jgi:hypothetical protein
MNPTNILPIIIANNGAPTSELGSIVLLVGYGLIALFVIVTVIRWTILDFIENRRPERKAALAAYARIYAEKAAKREADWQAARASFVNNGK